MVKMGIRSYPNFMFHRFHLFCFHFSINRSNMILLVFCWVSIRVIHALNSSFRNTKTASALRITSKSSFQGRTNNYAINMVYIIQIKSIKYLVASIFSKMSGIAINVFSSIIIKEHLNKLNILIKHFSFLAEICFIFSYHTKPNGITRYYRTISMLA